jgi:hypothetical protein
MGRAIVTDQSIDRMALHPSTELRRSTLSLGAMILLVISAASPMSVVAGGFPVGIMLGNGPGTPALVITALLLLVMFCAGYTAMAASVTSSGGLYALVARGLGGAAAARRPWWRFVGYLTLQFGLYGMLGAVASETSNARFGLDAFAAFIGFEATTLYGEEASNPKAQHPDRHLCSAAADRRLLLAIDLVPRIGQRQ